MCKEGYSLHGHGKFECSIDGVWIGDDSEVIKKTPQCEGVCVHACRAWGFPKECSVLA